MPENTDLLRDCPNRRANGRKKYCLNLNYRDITKICGGSAVFCRSGRLVAVQRRNQLFRIADAVAIELDQGTGQFPGLGIVAMKSELNAQYGEGRLQGFEIARTEDPDILSVKQILHVSSRLELAGRLAGGLFVGIVPILGQSEAPISQNEVVGMQVYHVIEMN
jgi:hypothetical protein